MIYRRSERLWGSGRVRRLAVSPGRWNGRQPGGAEDDDFEGTRNWSVIIVLGVMLMTPVSVVLMLVL